MSYESEERYWTDYLRVALPVIGLLLMLALFWWWAQNFIGDEKSPDEVANQISTEIATQAPPTPTFTVEAALSVTEAAGETPTTVGGVATDETPSPDPTTQDCGFSPGDDVVIFSNAEVAYQSFTNRGACCVSVVDPCAPTQYNHQDCYNPSLCGVLTWFETLRQ